MSLREQIETRIKEALDAEYVEVQGESARHEGHSGSSGGHYLVTVVTSAFEGLGLVAQHRMIYDLFKAEMKESIHAMVLKTFTPEKWKHQKASQA